MIKLLILSTLFIHSTAREPLQIPTTLFLADNLQNGDQLIGDTQLRSYPENGESYEVSMSSEDVSIEPTIIEPGSEFRILANNIENIRNNASQYNILAIGLNTGDTHEIPLQIFSEHQKEGEVVFEGTIFPEKVFNLKLETSLREKEIAIVKISASTPRAAHFTLRGPQSSHFEIRREEKSVLISTIPCQNCRIPAHFTLILVNNINHEYVTLNFGTEEKELLQFTQSVYETAVEEESSTFKKMIKLRATGPSEVVYSLEDLSGLFAVHPKNGLLSIQHPEFLFIDTVGETVNVTAVALSGAQRTTTNILIHVVPKKEEHGFQFEKDNYVFTVDAAQRGVGNISVNSNEGNVNYRISEGEMNVFTVDHGVVMYTAPFENDSKNYSLLINAHSLSAPFSVALCRVDVRIQGIGSNPVNFDFFSVQKKNTKLAADSPIGTEVLSRSVSDEDSDAKIEFSLTNQRAVDQNGRIIDFPEDTVGVESEGKTARIVLKKSVADMPISSFIVSLNARDTTHSNEPAVKEDIEVFLVRSEPIKQPSMPLKLVETPTTVIVPSSLPIGSTVYQIRTKNPDSDVKFSLDKPSTFFGIDGKTGRVLSTSLLTKGDRVELPISVTDGSSTVGTTLTIEVASKTDNEPRFKSPTYMAEIPANIPLGTVIANVSVEVPINVTYSLSGSLDFIIDQQGMIRTASVLSKDIEEYLLLAAAHSEFGTGTAEVIVAVDTNSEKQLTFEKGEYNISTMENIPINSYLLETKIVSSKSGNVVFSLESEDRLAEMLNIDKNGRITTSDEFSGPGAHVFIVRASEEDQSVETKVHLTVQPAFNCIPEFMKDLNDVFRIEENAEPDVVIGSVSAVVLDEKCNMKYSFWDSSAHKSVQRTDFASIDEKTGEMRAEKSFDYEKVREYPMILCLVAGETKQILHASQLIIEDKDDHPIRFDMTETTVEVMESEEPGSTVVTVTAIDMDRSQQVFYQLKDTNQHFIVDEMSGEVKLDAVLDREKKDYYELEVGASNTQTAPIDEVNVWSTVKIFVRDVNDNGPIFSKGKYEVLVSKNELPGKMVVRVNAVDPDMHENGKNFVFYSLADSVFEYKGMSRPIQGVFAIDQISGKVTLVQPINDFVGGVFHLVLQSADSLEENARKDKSILRIYVHDDSDIIRTEIEKSPLEVQMEDINALTRSISNSTNLKVFLKDVGYSHIQEHLVHDATKVHLILINKTTSESVPAEKALAIVWKIRKQSSLFALPSLSKAQNLTEVSNSSVSPIFVILAVFALLLLIICVLFALLICHYRKSYEREVKLYLDDAIISSTINTRPKQRPIAFTPPPLDNESDTYPYRENYGTQERKMSVGPDDYDSRQRH